MNDQTNLISGLKEQLAALSADVWYLAPELTLFITVILILVFDLLFKNNKQIGIFAIAFSGLAFAFFALSQSVGLAQNANELFNGLIRFDGWSVLVKMGFVLAGLLMLIIASRRQSDLENFGKSSELWIVSITLILGACLMSMSINLIMIYISIELVSISSYILTGLQNGKQKSEAALKYVLFGAVASAVMIYGMSWLYGFTGTLNITDGAFYSGLVATSTLPLAIALTMTIAGFVFKLGAFPFHIWSPDVYQAAPTPIVALFSFVPKIAALTILFRFVQYIPADLFNWQLWVGVIAIGSMTVGNFSALWQKDAKRMMAYSSIAQAGFLLVGLLAYSESGNIAVLFYATIYLVMNFGAFLLIQLFEKQTGTANIKSLSGLGLRIPLLGIIAVVVMIALTGLPPTAGFSAKLFIFSSLWESWQNGGHQILLWVFIVGLLNTVVALFFYLKIPYYLFFKSSEHANEKIFISKTDLFWGTIFTLPLLVLFFKTNWLVDLFNNISFVL